jgi:replication factor A1
MATQDIIRLIQSKHPEVTVEQIMECLSFEKTRSGGLLGDETILRLIAAKYGVEVPYNKVHMANLSSGRLFAGFNNVTVAGRLIAVFPVKTFQGEKSGKFATLMIADNDGVLRVVLWNEKADLVEQGALKVGQVVRLVHGYTRQDRYGKTELHLGGKSQIETGLDCLKDDYPSVEKFTTKISDLPKSNGTVHLIGVVKEAYALTTFTRSDMSDGTVKRFKLSDDSGEVMVVAWNEKADELERVLRANSRLQLINARAKEGQNGAFEVHVDSNVFVNVEAFALQFTKIGCLNVFLGSVNVEGTVSSEPECKEVTTSKGETVKLLAFDLKDESGNVRVSAWRKQAEDLKGLKLGDKVTIENVYVKKGYGDKVELSIRNLTVIVVKKP